MMELLMVSLAFLIIPIYAYLIYPVLLFLIGNRKNIAETTKTETDQYQPPISIIVPVYNGENLIAQKIKNLAELHYPTSKLEIIIVSDGSNDGTNQLLDQLDQSMYRIIQLPERVGKETALQKAASTAQYDILCFIDLGTDVNPDGIAHLVKHFDDPVVGAVSSVDHLDKNTKVLEALHVNYVCNLRHYESKLSSSVGVSGCFFAARKQLFQKVSTQVCSDLGISLQCVIDGFKAIVEKNAVGRYACTNNVVDEYTRKVRTIVHGISTLLAFPQLFNIRRYGWFSIQLISHKLLRWLSPLAFTLSMVLVTYIIATSYFKYFLIFTIILLMTIALNTKIRKLLVNNFKLFLAYNLAVISAIKNLATGSEFKTWEPTQRD